MRARPLADVAKGAILDRGTGHDACCGRDRAHENVTRGPHDSAGDRARDGPPFFY
jgi:hypothetical protein